LVLSCQLPARLPLIDFVGHAHFGAGDDAETVGMRFERGFRHPRIMERCLGELLCFKDFG
jgi:hypothetical protein